MRLLWFDKFGQKISPVLQTPSFFETCTEYQHKIFLRTIVMQKLWNGSSALPRVFSHIETDESHSSELLNAKQAIPTSLRFGGVA